MNVQMKVQGVVTSDVYYDCSLACSPLVLRLGSTAYSSFSFAMLNCGYIGL